MINRSKILLASASIAVLMAGGAYAQDAGQKANEAAAHADKAADQAGAAASDAASATGTAVRNAADSTGEAVNDAATATGNAVNDAATATGNALNNAAEATSEAASDLAEAADNATDNMTADNGPADGTPLEGQIFVQSADTFLASVVLDTTVVNAAGEDIGDVNDLVLTSDGRISGVVIGVGGFLGVGEKDVALEMQRLNISVDPDGDLVMTLNESEEALEAAPEFITAADRDDQAEMDTPAATPASAPSTTPATTQ